MIFDILASALLIIGSLLIFVTLIGLWRNPDPITQANIMGPATGVGLPLIIVAKLIHDIGTHGFDLSDLLRAIFAIAGYLVILAIGAFLLGRSLYAVAHEAEQESEELLP